MLTRNYHPDRHEGEREQRAACSGDLRLEPVPRCPAPLLGPADDRAPAAPAARRCAPGVERVHAVLPGPSPGRLCSGPLAGHTQLAPGPGPGLWGTAPRESRRPPLPAPGGAAAFGPTYRRSAALAPSGSLGHSGTPLPPALRLFTTAAVVVLRDLAPAGTQRILPLSGKQSGKPACPRRLHRLGRASLLDPGTGSFLASGLLPLRSDVDRLPDPEIKIASGPRRPVRGGTARPRVPLSDQGHPGWHCPWRLPA